MTTEPKDERGGDEAKRSALTPSDPLPVREAVTRGDLSTILIRFANTIEDQPGPARMDSLRRFTEELFALYADPLPVSREAVAKVAEFLRDRDDAIRGEAPDAGEIEASAEAILAALTGETSRE